MRELIILEDKAQKEGQHEKKNRYFEKCGVSVHRVPLPVGDYVLLNNKSFDVMERKAKRGVDLKKMDFLGTYDVCVDSKFSIQELIGDICGKSHERFRDECILAQNNGIKLYILIENEYEVISKKRDICNKPIHSIDELFKWINKRSFIWQNGKQKYPTATKGATLAKACITMQKKYGVEFLFCTPEESGQKIMELLGAKSDG